VSTQQQADEGVSLEAQRSKLRAYAFAMDLELVALCEDAGVSAKSLDRPGLRAALELLEQGKADGLVVAKLDRLTRSVRDLGELVERYFESRFSLLCLADSLDTRTASGRLVLHVLGAVSQWEREATAERTRDALAQVKADGGILGREGFGWSAASPRPTRTALLAGSRSRASERHPPAPGASCCGADVPADRRRPPGGGPCHQAWRALASDHDPAHPPPRAR